MDRENVRILYDVGVVPFAAELHVRNDFRHDVFILTALYVEPFADAEVMRNSALERHYSMVVRALRLYGVDDSVGWIGIRRLVLYVVDALSFKISEVEHRTALGISVPFEVSAPVDEFDCVLGRILTGVGNLYRVVIVYQRLGVFVSGKCNRLGRRNTLYTAYPCVEEHFVIHRVPVRVPSPHTDGRNIRDHELQHARNIPAVVEVEVRVGCFRERVLRRRKSGLGQRVSDLVVDVRSAVALFPRLGELYVEQVAVQLHVRHYHRR